ncbi:B12-binding domain-containing radical SAM protein [Salisediminibacterium halotolerans]|uniref:B12-binding domain-containing radical SAM protein n=1 Tax=Salisediminibacterium halotolerans TaxID=517425 RepID=UPI000EB4E688|nr:B12-binding domain-containing radical SAM protein [Salisediminibacterium halotolerans]RLJ74483.1 anaerobic magnesium-protoporphyrin IX monomethyl ester cyclase [Actinophytocola xinjiangensis]RPE87424.1 anaerobic magnesium-protoporphyrin IX monomethyl ester cyclase [Salisediminibacterium halotolerans]TWG35319.1 anaerobic magnesium-protoporphyrin IX monomethyl ester cyclase [Salisediminibacterium halotolerans]GEL07951.1 B12-binding domain-containing radical SAM protein [Salisediminibacterium h
MKTVVSTLNAKYIHTNLALRLLKAAAEPEFKITMKEYTISDPDMNIVRDLYEEKPDVLGFSCYIWNIDKTLQITSMIKKILPDCFIILGGPEVSYDTHEWMSAHSSVDAVIRGEGEEAFLTTLRSLRDKSSFEDATNLSYRKDTKIRHRPAAGNLDVQSLTTPYRFSEDRPDLSKRIVYFETSRGCPFLCQFCLSSLEQGVRYFPLEDVKADLLYLIANGAKMIKFVDRTFNINREYALEIFQFLIDNHQGCQFQFEITADIMRPEVLDFLNENAPKGIFRFEIGVQSTNEETNAIVKRKQNFNKLSRTVQKIKEGGKIDQHLDLIAGLPEENYDSFRQTFNDVFAMRPEELQLGFLKMLRGTGMREMADHYGYAFMDHAPYEILSNNVLPFDDILRIQRLEDVLEKYWNSRRFDLTMTDLMNRSVHSPFDFFQQFGDLWEEKGYSRIGHQFTDLFHRLKRFIDTAEIGDLITADMMKLDYLLHFKQKPRRLWWREPDWTNEETTYFTERINQMPSFQAGNRTAEKAIAKKGIAVKSVFDWERFLQTGEINEGSYLSYIRYDLIEPSVHSFSMNKAAVSPD